MSRMLLNKGFCSDGIELRVVRVVPDAVRFSLEDIYGFRIHIM